MSAYTDEDVEALVIVTEGALDHEEAQKALDRLVALGWAKYADVLAPVIGWREYDWPEGFDRRTAELIAEHAKERNSENV